MIKIQNKLTKLIAMIVFLTAGNVYSRELPNGFRGLTWGSSLSALGHDITPLTEGRILAPNEKCFSRMSDKLEFDGSPLTAIEYCYYKGKLYSVNLIALDAYKPFIEASLVKAFGPSNNGFWGSGASTSPTIAFLAHIGSTARLMLSSRKIIMEQRNDAAEKVLKSF